MGKDGNKSNVNVLAAHSCIHFDFSKEECIQNYLSVYNRIRFTRLLNSLQPTAKNGIISKIGFKVFFVLLLLGSFTNQICCVFCLPLGK